MTTSSLHQFITIGYDPGFGNTSVCVNGRVQTLQTAAALPNAVGLAAIGMRSAGSQAYVDWLYDAGMQLRPNGSKAEVAVMDIGMNTLDLYVVQGGQVLERHIGGAEVGVRRLLEILNANSRDLVEVDADLRNGRLRPAASQLDAWLTEILAAAKRSWPSLKRFNAVIPTGGGAMVLGDRLHTALAAKGAAIHWPNDPLTANVRGFWKYGLKYAA